MLASTDLTPEGFDDNKARELGVDGDLWLETWACGNVPPSRPQVESSVAGFLVFRRQPGLSLLADPALVHDALDGRRSEMRATNPPTSERTSERARLAQGRPRVVSPSARPSGRGASGKRQRYNIVRSTAHCRFYMGIGDRPEMAVAGPTPPAGMRLRRRFSLAGSLMFGLLICSACGGGQSHSASPSTTVSTIPASPASPASTSATSTAPIEIMHEDFAHGVGPWPTADDQYVKIQAADGGYQIFVKDPSFPQEARHPLHPALPSVRFEADVTQQTGSAVSEAHGLSCYQSATAGYLFLVNPAGHYVILKVINGKTGDRVALAQGESGSILGIGATNHLRIDCLTAHGATTLVLWVNGQKVAQAQDPQAGEPFARIGFAVFASQPDTSVIFAQASAFRL